MDLDQGGGGGGDIRNGEGKQHSTMIRERKGENVTGRHRRNPRIWATYKVNARCQLAIPPVPGRAGRGWMKIPPDVRDTTRVKKVGQGKVLSLDVSSAEEPKRSRARSKTVLKSPHKTVGIEESTVSEILLKNRSLAGLRLGAYRQSTRKVASWKENSHIRELPGTSHQNLTRLRAGR